MGHWLLWCPRSCVSLDIWGTYFWKETQVCFWQELNFDYTSLRNKWMCGKYRNCLIYCTQLTNLSLQWLYLVTDVYTMHICSWLNSFQSVVACSWKYTHHIAFDITVFVFYKNGQTVLLLIITHFAYFCNDEDILQKFHFAVDRIILCAEQHTTVCDVWTLGMCSWIIMVL
jgi:hypothetical protein